MDHNIRRLLCSLTLLVIRACLLEWLPASFEGIFVRRLLTVQAESFRNTDHVNIAPFHPSSTSCRFSASWHVTSRVRALRRCCAPAAQVVLRPVSEYQYYSSFQVQVYEVRLNFCLQLRVDCGEGAFEQECDTAAALPPGPPQHSAENTNHSGLH